MATGTSNDERDDDLTEPIGDDVDASDADLEAEADADAKDADETVATEAAAAKPARDKKAAVKSPEKKSAEAKTAEKKTVAKAPAKKDTKSEPAGIAKFLREVGVELKKVVTPTRKELWRYVAVVLGFLVVMMLIVTGLDFFFGFVSSWVFGNGTELFPAGPAPIEPVPTTP